MSTVPAIGNAAQNTSVPLKLRKIDSQVLITGSQKPLIKNNVDYDNMEILWALYKFEGRQ